MSESGDYSPGPWAGHDFGTIARQSYDRDAGRSYERARAANVTASQLVPDFITTDTTHPLMIEVDFSGSMLGWPGVFMGKFPYLDHEVRTEYLSAAAEVCFMAHCDTADVYPLQVQPFAKGTEMKTRLEKLLLAGGGGGSNTYCEAHGLPALYSLHNVRMPKAIIKPICIFITDEMPHPVYSREHAEAYAKVHIEKQMTSDRIFEELMQKFSVYVVLKPYSGPHEIENDTLTGVTKTVHDEWKRLVGSDRIAILPEADRVVDVIFGLLAQETGRVDYFRKEIEGRQKPDQVATVYTSLKTVHGKPATGNVVVPKTQQPPQIGKGKSTLHRPKR